LRVLEPAQHGPPKKGIPALDVEWIVVAVARRLARLHAALPGRGLIVVLMVAEVGRAGGIGVLPRGILVVGLRDQPVVVLRADVGVGGIGTTPTQNWGTSSRSP
jgi:hypothetical protein